MTYHSFELAPDTPGRLRRASEQDYLVQRKGIGPRSRWPQMLERVTGVAVAGRARLPVRQTSATRIPARRTSCSTTPRRRAAQAEATERLMRAYFTEGRPPRPPRGSAGRHRGGGGPRPRRRAAVAHCGRARARGGGRRAAGPPAGDRRRPVPRTRPPLRAVRRAACGDLRRGARADARGAGGHAAGVAGPALGDHDRRADRQALRELDDVGVAHADASVRDPARHEIRAVGAVDPDEAAGRPASGSR